MVHSAKYFKIGLCSVFGVLLLCLSYLFWQVHQVKQVEKLRNKFAAMQGVYLSEPVQVPSFDFMDQYGQMFTQQNLEHHWSLIFFGFTNCGMVCPTTLSALNQMYTILVNKRLSVVDLPHVIFISVDPENDTTLRLKEYLGAFNKHFIGLRASVERTQKLEQQLHIVAEKIYTRHSKKEARYTINHTAEILVVNPKGKIQAYFAYPHPCDELVRDYLLVLNAYQGTNA